MCIERGIRQSWFSRQHGLTLIELILFILIVSVSIAGILLVLYKSIRTGSDPVVRKQAIAIAESLLEEVELMPFTYCDTNDANVLTATGAFVGAGGCAATVQGIGPQAGETRYSSNTPFDNVGDYSGFDTNTADPNCNCPGNKGICDITGTCNTTLTNSNYHAQVTVAQDSNLGSIAQTEALRITVTVTGPGNTSVTLDGYRTRYAPNTTQ